jgi:mannose-6-phosphate isomerase-like protein (cupin superfamily)
MNEKWKAFDLEKLLSDYVGSNETWHKFLDKDTLITGIYILSSGAMDEQLIHKMDEVYLVLEGKATLKIENDTYEAKKGSIFYVKANIEHKFINIEKEIIVLVFFSKVSP